jgi:hypothetical protein
MPAHYIPTKTRVESLGASPHETLFIEVADMYAPEALVGSSSGFKVYLDEMR